MNYFKYRGLHIPTIDPPPLIQNAAALLGVVKTPPPPDFDTYRESVDIFENLNTIDSFKLAVKLSDIGAWPASATPNRLAYRLYDFLETILGDAGFFQTESLETEATDRDVTIRYTDPEYGFVLTLDSTGALLIQKPGSTMKRFHDWYWKIVPHVAQLISIVISFLSDEFKREAGFERQIRKQSASYQFSFIVRNLRQNSRSRIVKNTEVVRRLLPLVPDNQGALTDELSPSVGLGRAEYVAHRTVNPQAADYRREVYQVSAPSNWDWTSLWFTFSFVGDVYIAPDGTRYPFDEKTLIGADGLRTAYVDFLRDRALRGFMHSILGDYEFDSISR